MTRPRILLVPAVSELEWRIRTQLAEWAEVASYDAPGVGHQPPAGQPGPAAVVERGLSELDRRGWERCVVVGDESGAFNAARLAAARPAAVRGLVLGHACLSARTEGARSPLNGEVVKALLQIQSVDYRAYARAMTQVTRGAYDATTAERFIERVPWEVDRAYANASFAQELALDQLLAGVEAPLLLVEHRDCAMWSREGFEDVVAAFPRARTASFPVKPSASPDFAELVRDFCQQLEGARA